MRRQSSERNPDIKSETPQNSKKERGCCGKFWKAVFAWYWRPKPSLLLNVIIFFIIAIIFLILGALILAKSYEITEVYQRYDNIAECFVPSQTRTGFVGPKGNMCTVNLELPVKLEAPVYLYYEIDGFYQNHRRYVGSIDLSQMRGHGHSSPSRCEPFRTNQAMKVSTSVTGADLVHTDTAIPCGVAAKYLFNDEYALYDANGNSIPIADKGFVWPSDQEYVFNNQDLSKQWVDMNNERFIVWMKIAPFSKFRKPWGVIHQDLLPGKYKIVIENNWDVKKFSGTKALILTTTNIYGGRNLFLGYSFIVVGGLSLISGIIFGIKLFRGNKTTISTVMDQELNSLVRNQDQISD